MKRRVYQDPHSKTWLVAGKEHSWGSFSSSKAARDFIAEVEEEDRRYWKRWAARPRVNSR